MQIAWNALQQSMLQFAALFGLLIAGGALLTLLSRWTNNSFRQFVFPHFGMYAFGWLGVPVHELSHAVFCKLFLHEIKSVKWFDPKGRSGTHGSVTHAYHPWNPYHRIGHFFIGLGPVLIGPCLLAGLLYLLVPASRPVFHMDTLSWPAAGLLVPQLFGALANETTLTSAGFYVFLYLAVCISSQMELSWEDIRQSATGVIPLVLILFAFNLLAHWLNADWHGSALRLSVWVTSVGSVMFTFAAFLAALNLLLCAGLMSAINKLCGREAINPFRGG
jgi:hypothetical protein